jgi:hypothetical protein
MTNSELKLDDIVDKYYQWLRASTFTRVKDGIGEITTPFLDRHNDALQIYVTKEGNNIVLSDFGHTISDLEMCGCKIDTEKRKKIFSQTINKFGIKSNGEDLYIEATANDVSWKKHCLIQAILAINDIFYTATGSGTIGLFSEQVNDWFIEKKIRFTSSVSIAGKSGIFNNFDFLIPASNNAPERLIKTVNNPNKESAKSVVFTCIDTKASRVNPTAYYAIINDKNKVDNAVLSTLNAYDVKYILWSNREDYTEALVA